MTEDIKPSMTVSVEGNPYPVAIPGGIGLTVADGDGQTLTVYLPRATALALANDVYKNLVKGLFS